MASLNMTLIVALSAMSFEVAAGLVEVIAGGLRSGSAPVVKAQLYVLAKAIPFASCTAALIVAV